MSDAPNKATKSVQKEKNDNRQQDEARSLVAPAWCLGDWGGGHRAKSSSSSSKISPFFVGRMEFLSSNPDFDISILTSTMIFSPFLE
jgi:hypothetical protein